MSKRPSPSPRKRAIPAAVAPAVRTDATKGSINLRIEAQTRKLIDDAAALLGKTRTDFMIESARKHAVDVLLDQQLFALDPARYDEFVRTLNNPPAPASRLRALLRRPRHGKARGPCLVGGRSATFSAHAPDGGT